MGSNPIPGILMKMYGPYLRKDGRQHVILVEGSARRTVSYPKWILEQAIGRSLADNEVVHHKDENPLNNEITNLEILDRATHGRLHTKPIPFVEFLCVWCGKQGTQRGRNLRHNAKLGKAGPFCSKHCAGEYGASVQNGSPRLPGR